MCSLNSRQTYSRKHPDTASIYMTQKKNIFYIQENIIKYKQQAKQNSQAMSQQKLLEKKQIGHEVLS